MARVLISAGHTVMDPGAVFQDMREADLTRAIAPKIIPLLEKAGVEVQGVPLDLPLWQRLEWINNTGYTDETGDILVEIHVNDADGSKRGIEGWYRGKGDNNSQKLAKVLLDVLEDEGYESQGIKSEFEHELGSLTFLNRSNPAAVLLETLYMDNPEDIKLLKDESELEKLAKAVAKAVLKYLGKNEDGKDLPEKDKPKFDDLKPYQPKTPTGSRFSGLDDDDDEAPEAEVISAPKLSRPSPTSSFTGKMPGMPPSMPSSLSNRPAVPGSSFPTPSTPSFSGPGGGGSNMMMDRQERKQMIEDTYVKILGRKPSQSDLNYFLNMGISESDLLKKMMESQEHADIVKSKQQYDNLQKEHDDLKSQLKRMETTMRDQKEMLQQLNQSIIHKNRSIKDFEQKFSTNHGVPSSVATSSRSSAPSSGNFAKNIPRKKSFTGRLFDYLSQRLS